MSKCTLRPFTSVLCRDNEGSDRRWKPDIFLYYEENAGWPYVCAKHNWSECIPYAGNEHLAFTFGGKDETFAFGDKVLVTNSLKEPNWKEGIFIEMTTNENIPFSVMLKENKTESMFKYCKLAE